MSQTVETIGRIDPSRIRNLTIPKPDPALIERLRAITDPTPTVSDAFDLLGIEDQVVAASSLMPTIPSAIVVGPAVTVRNQLLDDQDTPHIRASSRKVRQAEIEAHNISTPGDVIVIQGVRELSNMGGISADMARRQGTLGAIVSGGIRDVEHSRESNFPFWSSERTPKTGKFRLETLEINGRVQIFGVTVQPGDIVVADATGVCFIPQARLAEVVAKAEEIARKEATIVEGVNQGLPFKQLFKA